MNLNIPVRKKPYLVGYSSTRVDPIVHEKNGIMPKVSLEAVEPRLGHRVVRSLADGFSDLSVNESEVQKPYMDRIRLELLNKFKNKFSVG